ncbi:tRNA (32-2'-O)-methyltransferase regulator THADA-like [Tubulanus polymorphus]|uniref:tRNA (32-2'-O)-methyltransferase regulator THADA-like n=1 Tax=Tubulanus polymorphus TaxID=672921 RepID=UPI003DA45E4A
MKEVVSKTKPAISSSIRILELIPGLSDERDAHKKLLLEITEAKDIVVQLQSVKKLGISLKNVTDDFEASKEALVCIKTLVDLFFICPGKVSLKRAVLSCLQGAHQCLEDLIVRTLGSYMDDAINSCSQPKIRPLIYTISNLTDNFTRGDLCLTSRLPKVLQFLVKSLEGYKNKLSDVSSPVIQTELMNHCLATVQTSNKLFQKYSVEPDEFVHKLLIISSQVLTSTKFLLDCQVTCGMSVALIFRLLYKDDCISMLCYSVMNHSNDSNVSSCCLDKLQHPVIDFHSLSVSSQLCVVNGILAVLTSQELVTSITVDTYFINEVLAKQIFESASGVGDTSSKLILSRTLYTWTVKCCQCLAEKQVSNGFESQLSGRESVPKQVLEYVWTHWEDPIDAIRHQSRSIFSNILKVHLLATKEDPHVSPLFYELATSLLKTSWHSKGKFGPLCTIVDYLGVGNMLAISASLPDDVLRAVREQTLASYASELFEKLMLSHKKELLDKDDNEGCLKIWQETWITPVLISLCHGHHKQKHYITEYIVPRLLKAHPDSIQFIISKLLGENKGTSVNELRALMTCVRQARSMGHIQLVLNDTSGMWNNVLPVHILQQALCHQDDQIRINALGLLCESAKTTEIVMEQDLKLLHFFLPLNLSSQSPAFRQTMSALFKKLFVRIKESSALLNRSLENGSLKRRLSNTEYMQSSLNTYREFVKWFWCELFAHLYPGSNYASRTSTLNLLITVTKAFHNDTKLCDITTFMTAAHVQTLIECFSDTFEDNKVIVLELLQMFPALPGLQTASEVSVLFNCVLALTCTTKPQDSTTAAYILRLLVRQTELFTVLTHPSEFSLDFSEMPYGINVTENDLEGRSLLTLSVLVSSLSEQLEVAKKTLLHAAATRPMYPVIHCIRYLLSTINLRKLKYVDEWRRLINILIDLSFGIAAIVSPIVSHSSPEGNVPLDSDIEGPVERTDEDEHELLKDVKNSVEMVQKMPKYLIVCCWRSVKEVSLTLGQLCQVAPIKECLTDNGLLTCEHINSIGDYFTTQLLESRHRGAFELAYTGFVSMSKMLWNCHISGLQQLPRQWLNQIMADIHQSNSEASRLCATRRSAGVPFYIQALVTSEPVVTGRSCFKQIMTELLHLALNDSESNNIPRVHALNILRSLYRDTRVGDDVYPFIADGVTAAVLGFSSNMWDIRNSSTLLFSALMTRIFGVKRTKDDQSRKNCLTGREFFGRFPALFQFLLDQMSAGTENIQCSGRYQLHPALYPVLMILGRLLPSTLEGTTTSVNVSAFIPYVIKCAGSSVYKTRVMAARALRPLVFTDRIMLLLTQLAQLLPALETEKIAQNNIHGILLQMSSLLNQLPTSDIPSENSILSHVHKARWILSQSCYVTRSAYLHVMCKLMQYNWTVTSGNMLQELSASIGDAIQYSIFESRNEKSVPGSVDFHLAVAHMMLYYSWENKLCHESTAFSYKEILSGLLTSQHYEVRLVTLQYIKALLSDDPEDDECDKDGDVFDSEPSSGSPDSSTPRMKAAGRRWSFNDRSQDIVTELRKSGLILSQVVAMAMVTETHPECLAEVLNVLVLHPLATVFPWEVAGTSYTAPEVMKWCLNLRKKQPREEVQCAAHRLSGILIPPIYQQVSEDPNSSVRELVCTWIRTVEMNSEWEQSNDCRLACAESLARNSQILLLDPDKKLGRLSLKVWKVTINLLQDDDIDVRQAVASMITGLWNLDKPDKPVGDMLATLSLDVALEILVKTFHKEDWRGCFNLLFDLMDGHYSNYQRGKEGPFEKSELNTYEDAVEFSRLSSRYLRRFLEMSLPSVQVCADEISEKMWKISSDSLMYQHHLFKPDYLTNKSKISTKKNPQISVTSSNGTVYCEQGSPDQLSIDISDLSKMLNGYYKECSQSLIDHLKLQPVFICHKFTFLEPVKYENFISFVYEQILLIFCFHSVLRQPNLAITGCGDNAFSFQGLFKAVNECFSNRNVLMSGILDLLKDINGGQETETGDSYA